ncbi:hypothetical protein HDU76_001057 [Blyttiomyces sp. JEL0837]|nr:hypothetical protein HDU76_001057 [Blyttiomyces sp. JEL0837]
MGGGGLQILQHKSWHVYSEKNRERVRKDEEKAREEEEKKNQQIHKAEQERRIAALRGRIKGRDTSPNRDVEEKSSKGYSEDDRHRGHVDLFADAHVAKRSTNAEYEAEKAAEKAKYEKQFTMYLGGEGGEPKSKEPWYAKPHHSARFADGTANEGKLKKRQRYEDPLPDSYIKKVKASKSEKTERKRSKGRKSIEELRQERLEREQKEKKRAQELVKPKHPALSRLDELKQEREMPFNSAFNPEISRQRRLHQVELIPEKRYKPY